MATFITVDVFGVIMTSINSFVTVCCMVPKFGAREFNSCWSGKWQSTGYMVRNCQCVIMQKGTWSIFCQEMERSCLDFISLHPGMFLLSSPIFVITTYFVIDRKVILLLSFLYEIYGIIAFPLQNFNTDFLIVFQHWEWKQYLKLWNFQRIW